MPTYQYACTVPECGHQFERVQTFSDNALTECPECSGRLRKVWGSIGVVFKGSGFYRNDSRTTPGESGAGKKKESASGDGAATAKSESSSAAKDSSATSASPAKAKDKDKAASTVGSAAS